MEKLSIDLKNFSPETKAAVAGAENISEFFRQAVEAYLQVGEIKRVNNRLDKIEELLEQLLATANTNTVARPEAAARPESVKEIEAKNMLVNALGEF